jgi:NAD(P)-dependent dehydrogenase (short-subunit alcohol dehydrogenase family)
VINIASIDGVSVNSQETGSCAASKAGLIHPTRVTDKPPAFFPCA